MTQLVSISSSHPSLPLNLKTNAHRAHSCLAAVARCLAAMISRPIRTTLAAACCRATLSDRHATLTSAPGSALSLGMCIYRVPMSPTYLPARILYVRVIFSDPRIRGGIGLVGCSGILGKNITRVLSNLPSCKMHPATTYSLA